ncbi:glycosyltransferase family 2 protein [Desulfobaculum bizertense]|uniref:glycosyltransferase family 2 protein n=1 Tax=Desulfobaculum bizertense TaxID=376490 RepID=UPI001F3BAB0B|nr:glycosyltransferase family 2 protein [Desulfobaculum bizertense]UIJ39249.1 glycosyltransferase family 2 protein [Desulfobaculum bizertense]
MNSPRLSVVIPVHNNFLLTKACLFSLKKHHPKTSMEVIIVDNASTDETATVLTPLGEGLFPGAFQHIRFPENRNFGPACNEGAQQARGEYLFLLNNDTEVTEGWFDPLEQAIASDDYAAVGPLLLYPGSLCVPRNRVQHLGVASNPRQQVLHAYEFFPVEHPVVARKRKLQCITGAALFMRRQVFSELGMFYPEYKNGFEDVDLCLTLREKHLKCQCVPRSVVYHRQGQTLGRYANDTANAELLSTRFQRYFEPDYHRFLFQDGYELQADAFLDFRAQPHASRMAELRKRMAEQNDLDACRALILEEPLFEPAYRRFIELSENAESAVQCAYLGHRFFGGPWWAVKLFQIGRAIENQMLMQTAQGSLLRYERQGIETMIPIAQKGARDASRSGNNFLSTLYLDWMKRFARR